jgi:hypothetical protein
MSESSVNSTIAGVSDRDAPHIRARQEQKAAWQAGKSKTVEQLLVEFPEVAKDTTAVLDLVYMEILHRDSKGLSPTLAEYSRRFPALSAKLAVFFPQETSGARIR